MTTRRADSDFRKRRSEARPSRRALLRGAAPVLVALLAGMSGVWDVQTPPFRRRALPPPTTRTPVPIRVGMIVPAPRGIDEAIIVPARPDVDPGIFAPLVPLAPRFRGPGGTIPGR